MSSFGVVGGTSQTRHENIVSVFNHRWVVAVRRIDQERVRQTLPS